MSWIVVLVLALRGWIGHVLFTLPFLGQEGFELVMAAQEGAAVAPDGCGGVSEGDAGWVPVADMLISVSRFEESWSSRRRLMKDEWFVLGIPQSLGCFDFLVGAL